ncbi:MAG: undecaprenyl/decaprenyl-phosphate alpha-N-acetylglucosaminyl 1-phosphate transferase [Planctomycetaceae bacterium]|nr:undecaprenyl/decaprenyl-phosphate alpha-N-acetylglucosaminyl 1-phosphate transferase [Planctomycetaceae bacterium]
MEVSLIGVIIVLVGTATCGTALLTWLARQIAPRLGFVDRPDGRRKIHRLPIPLLGGVAVFAGLLGTVTILRQFSSCFGELLSIPVFLQTADLLNIQLSSEHFLNWSLATAAIFCAIGVYDDRWPLRPRTKFCLQILACLPYVTWGRTITGISALGVEFELGALSAVLTVLWLVACVNAFNLIDGMDGQATSLGGIACAGFATLAILRGDYAAAMFSLLIVANLCGFLWWNRPPAKIFLGDAGSLMIGFLVGALALETSRSASGNFALIPSCVILAVPLFDTCMAVVRRRLNGRGIGEADREHIHHCLQDRGFSRWKALGLVSGVALIQGLLAICGIVTKCESLALWGSVWMLFSLVQWQLFGYREASLALLRLTQFATRFRPLRPRHFNPLEWLAF